MQDIERKRKAFHQEIRSVFLEDYFRKMRKKKLKDLADIEEEQSQNIEMLIKNFPQNIENIKIKNISRASLEKLLQYPHQWLTNCSRSLNICEWSCFIELILVILQRTDNKRRRIELLQSSKQIICSNFWKRVCQNKSMKRHIFMMILDLNLQIRGEIDYLKGQYLQVLLMVINQLLGLKFEDYENQTIKVFAICNEVLKQEHSQTSNIIENLFVQQKRVVFKMLNFIEQYGFVYKNEKTNVLLQMILILLINLTEHIQSFKFYDLFLRSNFLSVIKNVLQYPGDILQLSLSYYLKLIFNLIIESKQFSNFVLDAINFNQAYLKISGIESQLLRDIEGVLIQQNSI